MASKRTRNPLLRAFGQCLLEHRGARSRKQIGLKLAALGVPLDESSLFQYEAGTVWAPDAGVLWGLSEIYKVPLLDLVLLLRKNRAQPQADPETWGDLLRHSADPTSGSLKGGSADVPASARILELERRIEAYETALDTVDDVVKQLTDIAIVRNKGRAASRRTARRGRRPRKTG